VTADLLILEDDPDRTERFRLVASRLGLTPRFWPSAKLMVVELHECSPAARVISLDHDLIPTTPEVDPGDGLDVAKHLAALRPSCPVIIHTSNTRRGDAMEGELQLAGWTYRRVLPIGDDWIEVDWYHAARRLLRGPRRSTDES
jgi:hypothetical protein